MLTHLLQAVIESINRKKGKAKVRFDELHFWCHSCCSYYKVRFIGFNNMEEKELDELFLSKGEERRKEQESRGAGGIRFSSSVFFDVNICNLLLSPLLPGCLISILVGRMRSMI